MKVSRVHTLLVVVLAVASMASAQATITLYSSSTATASISTPGQAVNIFPAPATYYGGPLGMVGGWDQGPVSFTVPFNGLVTVGIDDCCLVGDIYGVAVGSAFWGNTSVVPLGGPTNSTGSFTFALTAGTYGLNITDDLLSYIGAADPWGGGTVPSGYSPAGFSVLVTEATPEPGTLALLAGGMLGIGGLVRRKLNL